MDGRVRTGDMSVLFHLVDFLLQADVMLFDVVDDLLLDAVCHLQDLFRVRFKTSLLRRVRDVEPLAYVLRFFDDPRDVDEKLFCLLQSKYFHPTRVLVRPPWVSR